MLMAAALAERRSNEKALGTARNMLIYAQEQGYHSIARELQTDIAGQMTLISVGFDNLRAACNANTSPLLDKLYDQVFDALNAILDLSHKIHPFKVEYLGLTRALTKLCRDGSAENGITITCSVPKLPLDLPLDISLRIFRVAQLALQNIQDRKAKTATFELIANAEQTLLRITDDGNRTDPHGRETLWLACIQEQVLSLSGTFKASSAPHGGMVIECSVANRS
jgi:signal transduction histidine kinase